MLQKVSKSTYSVNQRLPSSSTNKQSHFYQNVSPQSFLQRTRTPPIQPMHQHLIPNISNSQFSNSQLQYTSLSPIRVPLADSKYQPNANSKILCQKYKQLNPSPERVNFRLERQPYNYQYVSPSTMPNYNNSNERHQNVQISISKVYQVPMTYNNSQEQSSHQQLIQKYSTKKYHQYEIKSLYPQSTFTSQLVNLNNMIQKQIPLHEESNYDSQIKVNNSQQKRSILDQLHHIQNQLEKHSGKRSQQQLKISQSMSQMPQSYLKIGKLLGKGKFSVVHQVRDLRTDCLYALKIITKHTIGKYKMEDQIASEIKIQSQMNHPNILKFFYFFTDELNLYMVLEYAVDGELYKYMKNKQRLNEQESAECTRQVTLGLMALHQCGVIHRDIKPENILISFQTMKLSDLGCAIYSPEKQRQTFCGTLDYVSPEVAKGSYYSFEVDIWAIGILAFELTVGIAPFYDPNDIKDKQITLGKIIKGEFQYPQWTSPEFANFVGFILKVDQNQRPSLQDVLNHPWIQTFAIDNNRQKSLNDF